MAQESEAETPVDRAVSVGSSLRDKLVYLVSLTKGSSGRPMSLNELVDAIDKSIGFRIGRTTLAKLLAGQITNPHLDTVAALARYWGVPIEFFTDDAVTQKVVAEVRLLQTMRAEGVARLATRAEGLTPESLDMIGRLIDQARVAEGLDGPGGRSFRPRRASKSDD